MAQRDLAASGAGGGAGGGPWHSWETLCPSFARTMRSVRHRGGSPAPVADQVYDGAEGGDRQRAAATWRIDQREPHLPPFGVSRTPVRSAIIRLVEEELIEVFPQQGSFVAPISIPVIRDSHFVRRCLEIGVLAELADALDAGAFRGIASPHRAPAPGRRGRRHRRVPPRGRGVSSQFRRLCWARGGVEYHPGS